MNLRSNAEIESAVNRALATTGFSAVAGAVTTDEVKKCCAGVAGMHDSLEAIPISTIIALAMQLLPILFGEGGFTLEKLQAILQLISEIFEN